MLGPLSPPAAIVVRSLLTIDEFYECEALQRRAWKMSGDLDVVPVHLLVTVDRNGGLVLGAFDGRALIGFVFGFPGLTSQGRPKHCSYMMGVDPAYQGQSVGYRLKLAQRERVLAQGLDLVTWTYDPLESRNAALNVARLGAVCRSCRPDYYGPMRDGLNAGFPSDRFEVEWWIASGRVSRRTGERSHSACPGTTDDTIPLLNPIAHNAAGLPTPGTRALPAGAPALRVEIPADYQAVKAADPGLALEWRFATRDIFQALFDTGYVVVDFVRDREGADRRCFYVLRTAGEAGLG